MAILNKQYLIEMANFQEEVYLILFWSGSLM